jgi:FkbM family methyltransferase
MLDSSSDMNSFATAIHLKRKNYNFMLAYIKRQLLLLLQFFAGQKSYSQDGEDVALAAFFEGKKGYKGFFVDVGAHHPVRFSNTMMFYKRGWNGINIDPTPGSMRSFRWLRSRDKNLEVGIAANKGSMQFFCFNEPALNTFDSEVAKVRNTGKPYKIVKTVDIPIMPLADILSQYVEEGMKIDFLTIDVEGLDLQVLESNDWARFRPDFILVEDTKFNVEQPKESKIYSYLCNKNYKIASVLKRTLIFQSDH